MNFAAAMQYSADEVAITGEMDAPLATDVVRAPGLGLFLERTAGLTDVPSRPLFPSWSPACRYPASLALRDTGEVLLSQTYAP
jgi:hypothetical protein